VTIHQLPAPCWVITPRPPREDHDPHYDSRAEALTAIREAWDEDREWTRGLVATALEREWWREARFRLSRLRPGAPRPREIGTRCWAVQCDGDCGYVIDEEDEGYTVHHKSRTEAEETIADYEWVYSADGCLVFCADDAPEDAEPPPPSPAEQEAAGQLVIPGMLR